MINIVRPFDIALPAVIAEWDAGLPGSPNRYRVVLDAEDVHPGEPNHPLRGRSLAVEHHCEDAMGVERWHPVSGQEGEWLLSNLLLFALGLAPDSVEAAQFLHLWGIMGAETPSGPPQ